MKKLLLYFAILGYFNMSHAMVFGDFVKMVNSADFRDVTGTKDIVVCNPWVPFLTDNSISAGFKADLKGIFAGATCNNHTILVGISMRTIQAALAAIVISGGLYMAYKTYRYKKQKQEAEEELLDQES